MNGYIRTDITCGKQCNIFIIPTIELYKYNKGIEITLYFLCLYFCFIISYIKEEDYEP